jgi:hypothetical protein
MRILAENWLCDTMLWRSGLTAAFRSPLGTFRTSIRTVKAQNAAATSAGDKAAAVGSGWDREEIKQWMIDKKTEEWKAEKARVFSRKEEDPLSALKTLSKVMEYFF